MLSGDDEWAGHQAHLSKQRPYEEPLLRRELAKSQDTYCTLLAGCAPKLADEKADVTPLGGAPDGYFGNLRRLQQNQRLSVWRVANCCDVWFADDLTAKMCPSPESKHAVPTGWRLGEVSAPIK